MLGAARIVTDAVPLAVGDGDAGRADGHDARIGQPWTAADSCPLPSIVPTTASPPAMSFTLHVTPPAAPVTVAVNVWSGRPAPTPPTESP